jgi:parallel beta-helix repeat protein
MIFGLLFVLIPATACLANDSVVNSAFLAMRRDAIGLGIKLAVDGLVLAMAYGLFKRGRGILGRAFIAQWAMVFVATLLVEFFFLAAEDTPLMMGGSRTTKLMYLGFLLLTAAGYVICRLKDWFTGRQAVVIGITIGIITNPALFELLPIGATITVGRDAPTIVAAMKMARANDTVYVPTGLYKESDIKLKNGVRLRGDGIGKTVIRGRPGVRSWVIWAWRVTGRIENLTVEQTGATEALDPSGGIYVWNGNVPVVSCEARSTAGNGIVVKKSVNALVENCISTGNLMSGIFVRSEGSEPKVTGCTARGNKSRGIDMYADGPALIERNIVEKNYEGISASNKGGRFTIVGNTVRENTDGGIKAFGTEEVTIQENLCENNAKHGIVVWDNVERATIVSNRCSGNQDCAIEVDDAEAMVSANVCEDNISGIFVGNSPQANIEKNIIKGNTEGTGIYCYRIAEALVKDNECADCAGGGIAVENKKDSAGRRSSKQVARQSAAPTTGNDPASNPRDKNGIRRTTAGTARVTGNRCISNDNSGISTNGGGTIIINRNLLSKNVGIGLWVLGSSDVRAEGNTSQDNRQSGIYVGDPDTVVTLKSNKCIGNNHGGIQVNTGVRGEVSGNECLENGWCGIGIRDAGTSVVLKANRCDDNGAWGIITWAGAKLNGLPGDNTAERNFRGNVMERP